MSDQAETELWKFSVIESILTLGTFGILVVLSILLIAALSVWSLIVRRPTIARSALPLPAILGLMFYSFCIWRTVPEILHAPGVRDPNWYFYVTSNAALISFLGCLTSIILYFLTVFFSIRNKNEG